MGRTESKSKPARRRRARAGWIPNQHGAWAMLAVPFLVGVFRGGPTLLHLPLLGCWVVGYFAFFAAGLWLRSGRNARYVPPLITYTLGCALFGGTLALLRPDLLEWLLVYVPIAALSLLYSARRDDRALLNDIITIIAACLMAPIAFGLSAKAGTAAPMWAGGGTSRQILAADPAMGWVTLALMCYFVGTSLYVKTVIRERRSRAYHLASWSYHGAVTLLWLLAPLLGAPIPPQAHWLLVAFFVVMTVRAALMAGRRVRPMKVGLGEIAASTVLLLILVLAW
ncbi:YwiC-like family protein [Gephyromycinifex aptenodytis]|uniref:YwiC-like family protein n=1 Tax=Gephyromycinifex aptenodytis TaxID=2716227 RepID=UPI001447EE4F|nr:YwiC-like family protein [Gephyromycinifex aptenodytis]